MNERLALIVAINNKKPKDLVTKLFNDYLVVFDKQQFHSGEELMQYGRTYSMYVSYLGNESAVVRDIENKEDLKKNYNEKEDKGKDYFEHSGGITDAF